ncbi:hypothetical protein SASPL_135243 [Salvia splendens]|uniref:Uncharacterized protein n=1 Tax=Salvia splendens TaxID=180675 RepID=A0A8X8WXJ9_SALSN|nr:hypothetical protein SASPL_135243 [Salvia splendens]
MSHQVVKLRREGLAPCMTCPLCHKLFREATTIIECLHTYGDLVNLFYVSRPLRVAGLPDTGIILVKRLFVNDIVVYSDELLKCINKKLSDEELECCPVCNIDLGCVPLEKLRLDHNLQDVRAKIFPYKRMKVRAPEVVSPVTSPVKRKERSLSSLVVSTPRVSTQSGMTGRRSKSITRKASRDLLRIRGSSIASDPSNHASPDKGRENGFETLEGKVDWKPLNCLVEAANRTKSSKFSMQGVVSKSEAPNSHDNEGPNKSRSKENRQKSKLQDVKNLNNYTPPDSERPKKLRKVRQNKTQDFGEFRVPPQAVLDAAGAKFDRKNHPIWFSLVADGQEGDALPLPQIAASYFRIKEGGMLVSSIRKYLKLKLDLTNRNKCMGQAVIPTLTLNNVVDLWLQTTTTEKVSAKIGSSAEDLVMVLGYARRS